jgi:sugar phosphate isomerase/epimerase
MLLSTNQQLGYCTNVHPYDSLPGLLATLGEEPAQLRRRLVETGRLGDDETLGVGLWLPGAVATEVARDAAPLRDALAQHGLHAFTVNAFPYGDFHAGRVKDEVFRPTWAEAKRVDYTLDAATALAALLPEGAVGSVSTHTGGYKPWGDDAPTEDAITDGFLRAADGLSQLEADSGRRVVLAMEPEPLSFLETTPEVVSFFERRIAPAGDAARRHLGICFDACHQAVQYEDMAAALAALRAAGVPIAKVQLSSAIRVADPARHLAALQPWAEDRWFHQVVARGTDGSLERIADLGEALGDEDAAGRAAEWRIHFHVPLFAQSLDEAGGLGTTQDDLAALLALVADASVTPHLEIETYSFAMIPADRRAALGADTLAACLEHEFAWVLDQLSSRRAAESR